MVIEYKEVIDKLLEACSITDTANVLNVWLDDRLVVNYRGKKNSLVEYLDMSADFRVTVCGVESEFTYKGKNIIFNFTDNTYMVL